MALTIEGIVRIVGPNACHDTRSNKRSAVVDMAVGHLRVNTFLDPNNFLNTEVFLELLGHILTQLLAEGRILASVLRPIACIRLIGDKHRGSTTSRQETGIGDDQGSLTVNGNGATFENHMIRAIRANARVVGHFPSNLRVLLPREIGRQPSHHRR